MTEHGMSREEAYQIVQQQSMNAWESGSDFKTTVAKNAAVRALLSQAEIDDCFNESRAVRHVDYIFKKVGLE